jgi:mono/diheme cytochrome c family protein
VLPVALFIAFWVILAFALFFVAARGGLSGARAALETQSRGGRRGFWLSFAVLYIGFGIALPLAFLTGNAAHASKQIGGIPLTAADKHGRQLFGEHCGVCHTLAAANAVGKVGPNLDTLQPPASLIQRTIQYGCVQNATANSPQTCLGQGTMPSGILQGRDATDVANFVAKVAGKE